MLILQCHVCEIRFRGIIKSGLRSSYTCAACKGPIKAMQKLIKCSREIYSTVDPHLYGPQLCDSPDYMDPILPQINDIHRIFGVH